MLNLTIKHGVSEKNYGLVSIEKLNQKIMQQLELEKDFDFSEDLSHEFDYDSSSIKVFFYAKNSKDTVEFVISGDDVELEKLFSSEDGDFWESGSYYLVEEMSA